MDKKIKQILELAVRAPSGDNSQPWRFILSGNILEVYNLPDRDNVYLNYNQSGSYIAHGALLENIKNASSNFGLSFNIVLFPDLKIKDLVAYVIFDVAENLRKSNLFESITTRQTNRKPYEDRTLKDAHKFLLNICGIYDEVSVYFSTNKKELKQLGKAGSSAEIVILENDLLHKYLFKDIQWSENQEKKEKKGLYIKTMEFNLIQKLLFRLASYKTIIKLARKIKFPHFIASEDAKLYSSGSAIGILTIKKDTPENFVRLGMKMQELWLTTESLQIAFQPVSALLFLEYKLTHDVDDKTLLNIHKKVIKDNFQKITSIFKFPEEEIPLIMFRIGYASRSSATTSRLSPMIEIKKL